MYTYKCPEIWSGTAIRDRTVHIARCTCKTSCTPLQDACVSICNNLFGSSFLDDCQGAVAGYMWFYGAYHYFTRAHPAAHYDALASSVYFGYVCACVGVHFFVFCLCVSLS